jgi:DegV family protein with EDD domain
MIERTRFLFVPSTLEYLQRGGRIGRASALIGSVMQIRPILTASAGMTSVYARVRTNARALETILSTLSSDIAAKGGLGDVVVQHIHAEAAGRELVGRVSRIAGRAVELMPIGPVIGAHVGPGALGVAYHTVQPMMK